MFDPRTPEEMDAELDALIVAEREAVGGIAVPRAIEQILAEYRVAKRSLELLDQLEASGRSSSAPGSGSALRRHLANERVRALKYDLAVAVRAKRPGG